MSNSFKSKFIFNVFVIICTIYCNNKCSGFHSMFDSKCIYAEYILLNRELDKDATCFTSGRDFHSNRNLSNIKTLFL